ncbi:MAG: hypothetical protein IPO05_01775 [Flavobacteriales bacterium]|nr:hypothetical protein [Flavobacteriales bacterium]
MIRSAIDYARYFAHALSAAEVRSVLLAQHDVSGPAQLADRLALRAVIDHLCRCQDHGTDAGFGSYHLVHGHGPSYPETTGYIIPTFLAAAEVLDLPTLRHRALQAADWLLSIQRADGGWQGGRVGEERASVVFNTAQVLRGMLAAHAFSGHRAYLDAAVRAGDWMVRVQERDGSWAHPQLSRFIACLRQLCGRTIAPPACPHGYFGVPRGCSVEPGMGPRASGIQWLVRRCGQHHQAQRPADHAYHCLYLGWSAGVPWLHAGRSLLEGGRASCIGIAGSFPGARDFEWPL